MNRLLTGSQETVRNEPLVHKPKRNGPEHKAKMARKAQNRAKWWQICQARPGPTANLSRRHPDAGKSPLEHARLKAERLAKALEASRPKKPRRRTARKTAA